MTNITKDTIRLEHLRLGSLIIGGVASDRLGNHHFTGEQAQRIMETWESSPAKSNDVLRSAPMLDDGTYVLVLVMDGEITVDGWPLNERPVQIDVTLYPYALADLPLDDLRVSIVDLSTVARDAAHELEAAGVFDVPNLHLLIEALR